MTEQRTIKSIFTEVNRAIMALERKEAERIRRSYKPAHTRPSAPAIRARGGYSKPRPRYC